MHSLSKPLLKNNLWIVLTLPSLTLAETPPDNSSLQLPTLQVIEKINNIPPPNVSIITNKTLQERFIKNFDDLAKRAEPGVNFNRVNQSINIRGLDKNRILTTIDGIRLPYLDDRIRGERGGVDSINFDSLSKLDIIRGANTTESGKTTLGGAVNLYTLNPEDILSKNKNSGAIFKADYDSSDQSYGLNIAAATHLTNADILVQAGKRQGHELDSKGHYNVYGTKRTTPEPNDTKQENFLIKLQQELDNEHRIGVAGEQFSRIKDINLRTEQGTTYAIKHNKNRENVKRQRISADYRYLASSDKKWLDEANAIIYWQHIERGNKQEAYRNSRPIGNYMRNNQIQKNMYGMSGDISKFIYNDFIDQKLTLGGEWYQLNAKQSASGYDNCPIFSSAPSPWDPNFPLYMACSSLHTNQSDMPKTHGQLWAIHFSDEFSVAEGKVRITPGIRYDYYKHSPQNTNNYAAGKALNQGTISTSKDSKVSGSLVVQWLVANQATVYARWSQGFKAPDPTELYMNYINTGVGYATLGNSKLKPEESNNFELGTHLGNDQLGGSVDVFYAKYKNFIDNVTVSNKTMQGLGLNPTSYRYGVDRWENRSRVRIYGAEAKAHWQLATNWKIWSSAAWSVGKDQQTHQYLNSIAPSTAILGLSYQHNNYGTDIIFTTAVKRNKTENDSDFKTPGYGVVDFTAFWEPSYVKGLRLQVGVFNLMDKKYWNALNIPETNAKPTALQPIDYYSEPGRSFRLAATYQF